MPDRSRARELAAESLAKDEPLGWFENLYREAAEGLTAIPWDDHVPNSHLIDFWSAHGIPASGRRALVVGCGLGEDAEWIAACGFTTTAFDISPTGIKAARERFPQSKVEYLAADLFHAPNDWRGAFDFIFEANTLQAMPAELRPGAMERIAAFLQPSGLLLVIARAREDHEPTGDLPWPLTRHEFSKFVDSGLAETSFRQITDSTEPFTRRFLATYTRR